MGTHGEGTEQSHAQVEVSEMPSSVLKCFWCRSRPSHVKGPADPGCRKAEERSTLTRLVLEAAANLVTVVLE